MLLQISNFLQLGRCFIGLKSTEVSTPRSNSGRQLAEFCNLLCLSGPGDPQTYLQRQMDRIILYRILNIIAPRPGIKIKFPGLTTYFDTLLVKSRKNSISYLFFNQMGLGPVDNRPSTNYLHYFALKKNTHTHLTPGM